MSGIKENMTYAEVQRQRALAKLKELMDSFDKRYIETLFEECIRAEVMDARNLNQNLRYEYNGYRYILRREPLLKFGGMMPNVS